MEAPRRYSVSPLPSYCTVTPTQHSPSLSESLRLIWYWLRGVQPNWRETAREARIVEALAEEMEAEVSPTGGHKTETSPVRRNYRETSVSSHRRDESHGLRQR
jgi:hypothetical protein